MEGDRKLPELARRCPATPPVSSWAIARPDVALETPGAASEPTCQAREASMDTCQLSLPTQLPYLWF